MIQTLRELLRLTHCLNARACVAYNLQRVERARADLARAYAALDACEAAVRIETHVERPAVPVSLMREFAHEGSQVRYNTNYQE